MAKATDIPQKSRDAVDERDQGSCRACGRNANPKALHHIVYRSQERNNHSPSNLVTLGGGFDHNCHQMVHARSGLFRPALLAVVDVPGMTALAWLRQQGHDIRGLQKGSL